jgi:hypothetical protein
MWEIAETPEEVISFLKHNREWFHDPRSIAKI